MTNAQSIDVKLPPVPASIDWAKFAAVGELLGLPGHIRTLTIDVNDGITATLYPLDHDGRKILYGDDVLAVTVNIPFTRV